MESVTSAGLILRFAFIFLALHFSAANMLLHNDHQKDTYTAPVEVNGIVGRKMLSKESSVSGKYRPVFKNNDEIFKQERPESEGSGVPSRHQATEKDDSHAFLEAANEVVNLMGKDYNGADRPHRKPPIHNREPTD